MIPNANGWRYLAVKKLSALLRVITSKKYGDFYSLNCLHSSVTENKREPDKKVCENKDFYNVVIPSEEANNITLQSI